MQNQNQPLVYFIGKSNFGDDESDFIKIGHTTELSRRVGNIQASCESEISVMGVIPFDTKDEAKSKERDIHLLFRSFRSYREWFYATPRIIQYIKDYAVQYTELFTEDAPPTSDEDVVESGGSPIQDEETVKFGEWLRECREQRKPRMTQEQLAENVGYSRGYISFIEQGRGMPGQELSEALIGLFGEPPDPIIETKSNILAARIKDGPWISKDTAIDTFIEVIKELGIEKVRKLDLHINGIPLIANCDYEDKAQRKVATETRTYYIVSGTNTVKKASILEDIAKELKVDMTVLANPRS